MILELPEKYKGIKKEYKAKLSVSNHVYWYDKEKEKPYTDNMFEQMLKELDEMEVEMLINNKETKVKLKIQKNSEYNIFLFISTNINMKEYKYEVEKKFEDRNEDKDLIELIHIEQVMYDFIQQIQNFKIAVNISYPGLLEISTIETYVNNEHYNSSTKPLSSLLVSVTEANRDEWPKINIISINKSWNWLKQRKGFIKGMATNSIERALCALTYIYDCYSYEDLFYSMIGIESIYVKNKEGILQQIKDKSKALFGEPKDYMKRLKHMYNVRSRFIHGELNFPPRYCPEGDGNTKEFSQFSDKEYFDSLNMAQALLIASIQQFVLMDAEEIEFELKIKD